MIITFEVKTYISGDKWIARTDSQEEASVTEAFAIKLLMRALKKAYPDFTVQLIIKISDD